MTAGWGDPAIPAEAGAVMLSGTPVDLDGRVRPSTNRTSLVEGQLTAWP
jgi:hypothetical protein